MIVFFFRRLLFICQDTTHPYPHAMPISQLATCKAANKANKKRQVIDKNPIYYNPQ